MTTQTEMFPRTTLELLEELAEVHRADQDKAVKALDALSDDEKIARAYEKAEDRLAKARHLVAAIDQAAERERKRLITTDLASSVKMPEAHDIFNGGALDTEQEDGPERTCPHCGTNSVRFIPGTGGGSWACVHGHVWDAFEDEEAQVTASVSPAVDPITGEMASSIPVTDEEKRDELESKMDAERDETTGVVNVIYPGEKHARTTDVGSRTQYGELVADYLATLPAVSPHRDDPVAYYRVIGVDDEINRDLRSPVAPDDYGVELAVVRLVDVRTSELLEDAVR